MKSPLSPLDINVLLHCHSCPSKYPQHEAPAVKSSLAMLIHAGMISKQPGKDYYNTTPKGEVFIEALCNTPEPVQTWTVPARKED